MILGRTLPSLLDEACDRSPNLYALNQWTETGWQSMSNQVFRTAVEELALGLGALQLEKGDRITLLMHSDVNFCIADMGCLFAKLVDVPIDLTQTLENIVFILQHTEAKALIISNLDLLSQVVPYLKDTPNLTTLIVAEVPDDWVQRRSQLLCCQTSAHEDGAMQSASQAEIPASACLCIPMFLPHAQLDHPCPPLPQCIQVFSLLEVRARGRSQGSENAHQQLHSDQAAGELATLIYIPDATGQLQGVMLTHENLSANALAAFTGIPGLKFGSQEVVLSFLPLTHVFARSLLYGHINYGHSVYLTTPNRVMKHLKEVQPTIFATVPLLLEKIYSKILEQGGKRSHGRLGGNGHKDGTKTRFRLNFPRWRIPVSFLPSLLTGASQITSNWALNLAKRYKLSQKPSGFYKLQLKLADKLVFSQWRSGLGGRLKYLISGGAALKVEVANLFAAAGLPILQGYGLTESSS
ncbi:MAG: AMP-binding protein, partial [Microcystaceae cyanobacterium]